MAEHYTKSEIDLMHQPINYKLDKILDQTTKHNGRMDKMEQWRAYMTGGIAIMALIIVPILIWALNTIK